MKKIKLSQCPEKMDRNTIVAHQSKENFLLFHFFFQRKKFATLKKKVATILMPCQ